MIPLAMAWIGDVIPYERRQPILARYLSGQILGIVFGQAAGGVLGDLIGWRGAMLLLGAAHVIAGILLIIDLRGGPYLRVTSGRTRCASLPRSCRFAAPPFTTPSFAGFAIWPARCWPPASISSPPFTGSSSLESASGTSARAGARVRPTVASA